MILYPSGAPLVEIDVIKSVVSEAYGMTVEELVSDDRHQRVTVPRFVAIFLAWSAGHSTPRIALAFGKADHTNAIYARKRVRMWMQDNPAFAQTVSELGKRCGLESVAA